MVSFSAVSSDLCHSALSDERFSLSAASSDLYHSALDLSTDKNVPFSVGSHDLYHFAFSDRSVICTILPC